MFQLDYSPFGKYEKLTLQHPVTGQSLSVIPERGACLISLILDGVEVLDAYPTPEEVDFNRWGKSGILLPFPNRLKDGQFHWDGKDYQFPINDGGTNNALHGFGMDLAFSVTHVNLNERSAWLELTTHYEGDRDYYPFPFTAGIILRLDAPRQFSMTMFFRNDGQQELPAGLGWHPYFSLGERIADHRLQLPELQMVGIDDRMIPTGKRYPYDEFTRRKVIGATVLDNCFAVPQQGVEVGVHLFGTEGHLRYWQSTGPGKFNFMQLFTPPYGTSIAIEPMTCNVDAFNNGDGLARLAAGEELRAEAGLVMYARSGNSTTEEQ
ncbi:MAG: aldose 1-epimerase [Lewinella sp.]|nr:aldose 1-epimerase [Lewinella sp.]